MAPATHAAALLPPSISATSDRSIDTLMPPLLRTPATASVAPAQRDALRASLSVSRAFPQVTREFKQFLQAQAQISYATRDATAKVADQTAFAEMQRYLFNRYNGLTVLRSVRQGQTVFDCIPREQQPGLRDGSAIATPPPITAPAANAAALPARNVSQRCDAGSVPLKRIGIAELAEHRDLRAFLKAGLPPRSGPQAVTAPPVYSNHFHAQVALDVDTSSVTGAGADLNLWAPTIRNTDETQSISQIWIVGTSAQGKDQTLEAGWQVQPGAGWGSKPIVFIYSTQDGYATTGCHNLDCADFVQISDANVLGVVPSNGYSTAGGTQTMMRVEFQRNEDGYWWFGYNNEWIGYYKAELYSGDLANGRVAYINAGGETSNNNGKPLTMMGSGKFAASGYRQAAFQANHFYRDAAMVNHPIKQLYAIGLQNPSCYTLAIAGYTYPYALGAGVTRTTLSPEMQNGGFYFGGPGCPR
ncbi:neprosin family prolyl endopeptidase [Xanthomonas hortorum]|uniref:neprosin family prolyl endopeptidase n=1 Tax=Xanthomonas hortorum TaxID=56454 RepID=UPI0029359E54|nr:neprosin family prolyl endopeptidase [Xanthomonas hortorum]MDV2449495.1 neprosin family prolyl endopeptidase [Xanthomonas hortorum NBC5720]